MSAMASQVFTQPLFRRRSKKTSKFRVTGLCEENSPVTGEFPHKGSVTPKMMPFDGVIMAPQCDALPGLCLDIHSCDSPRDILTYGDAASGDSWRANSKYGD